MLRGLGIGRLIRTVLLAMVAVAVWEGFHGNVGAIVAAGWHVIQTGADVITQIWRTANGRH